MKSLKNVIFAVIVAAAILGQLYYLLTYYKRDIEQIADNKAEIVSVQTKIDQMNERLLRHEESKKELAALKEQQQALVEKIPKQNIKSRFMSNISKYIQLLKCDKVKTSFTSRDVITSDIGSVGVTENTISFIGPYEASQKLVENLNNMYQACNILSYSFDTGVQTQTGAPNLSYADYFGQDMSSLGETKITFDVYYFMDNTVDDEVYQADITGNYNTQPFKKQIESNGGAASGEPAPDGTAPTSVQSPSSPIVYPDSEAVDFTLDIGDILTSGDIYKLGGPGQDDGHYIGLNSTSNVTVTVTVYDDSYELDIADSEGNEKHSSVKYPIKNATFHIVSTMRDLQEVMPNVHVKINNYSSSMMYVSLSGTLLDNIHVFDVNNKAITKGQTNGNINLT